MKFQIIGAVFFVMLGAWMATFTDPIKDTFSNYEVDREVYTVYAGDLAKRIIDGDQSFMLIDIRGANADKKINIDRATPLAIEDFEKEDMISGFSKEKEIIVVSNDEKKVFKRVVKSGGGGGC